MAGAKTIGQVAVSKTFVSKSFAAPLAARESKSAVAGATITKSAPWPMRTCGTSATSSQTSEISGLPESASQVAEPTKFSAAGVGTT
jgi:hypothetical protein